MDHACRNPGGREAKMTSNDIAPYKPRGSGAGWAVFLLFILAIIGAVVLLPAFALVIGGILKLAFGLVFGIVGAVIGVVAALFASVVAFCAIVVGLAFAALPVVIVIAVLIGIGVLIGRSTRRS